MKRDASVLDFDYSTVFPSLMTPEVVRLLTGIHERRGRQGFLLRGQPRLALDWGGDARIASIGSSNRLEGIETTDERLRELVVGQARPKNRSEQEIAGYRFVHDLITEDFTSMDITPSLILQLHRDLYRYTNTPDAGRFKAADNVVAQRNEHGELFTRFVPASAAATPSAVERLCDEYAIRRDDPDYDPLVLASAFAFDFVSIQPFRDGNGRMSRLMFDLLLYKGDFEVGRYVSLEREIERSKDAYYDALWASSRGWGQGDGEHRSIVTYLLGIVFAAYDEFDRVFGSAASGEANEDRLRAYFSTQVKPASKAEILSSVPGMSDRTLTRLLQRLQADGTVERVGAARATAYRTRREP